MAATAPVHINVDSGRRKRGPGDIFRWVTTKDCAYALKLRHNFRVDARTRLELGLDLPIVDGQGFNQTLHASAPWAAMLYQIDEADPSKGAIEMNPLFITYNRGFTLGRKGSWWEVPLDAKLGLSFSGQPHVEVGTSKLPLALAAGVLLLALGKPISVHRKEVGNLAVFLPLGAAQTRNDVSLQERLEVNATLRREGNGLKADFQQLAGVLRLRHE